MKVKREVCKADLVEIAARLRKYSDEIIRVKIHARKIDILKICKDEATHKSIDVIHSATIVVDGVKFELVVSDRN